MENEIYVLIHGPFAGNAYGKIAKALEKQGDSTAIKVIIVTYKSDEAKTRSLIESMSPRMNVEKYVTVKDVLNPGFFNINRQIISVREGLSKIPANAFVIKLRNDQWIDLQKTKKILVETDYLKKTGKKFLTSNCYTRKDRLYHPSEMFLCGQQNDLAEYYGCPLMEETYMDCQLMMMKKSLYSHERLQNYFICPEIYLFKSFLRTAGWDFKNTADDSRKAIGHYFYLVNTWDIDLRWAKIRTPLLPAGSIIFPQYCKSKPFVNMPVETIRCYSKHDFNGKMTVKDLCFLLWARFLFLFAK